MESSASVPRRTSARKVYEPNLTPECKAEQKKRVDECKKRPDDAKEQAALCTKWGYDLPDPAKDLDHYCLRAVWAQMVAQSRAAATESLEVPEATMHDAKLEKAVAAAYVKEGYKDNKILKVVLLGWAEDLEKDGFGRVNGRDMQATVVNKHPDGKCELHYELWLQHGSGKSFSGALEARGAGSEQNTEIPCEKAEAAGGKSASGKKKSK